jgi:hypothetical protein
LLDGRNYQESHFQETIVSKRQSGFTSEAEAQEWGQKELKAFLQNLHEQNKRAPFRKNRNLFNNRHNPPKNFTV